jgi:hypothetical protein
MVVAKEGTPGIWITWTSNMSITIWVSADGVGKRPDAKSQRLRRPFQTVMPLSDLLEDLAFF